MRTGQLSVACFAICSLLIALFALRISAETFQEDRLRGEGEKFRSPRVTLLSAGKEPASKKSGRSAQLLRIPVPITGNIERRLIAQIRAAVERLKQAETKKDTKLILVLEFDPIHSLDGAGSEFEDCLKLSRFLVSAALNGIRTVAYLPKSLKGHAILVAMACDQIIMAPDSTLGEAGDMRGGIDQTMRSSYRQIAASRKTFPIEIAEGLIDPQRKLLQVKTDQGNILVFADDMKKLEQNRTIDRLRTETVFAGGEPATLTARQARDLGLVSQLVRNRADLALQLRLSRDDLRVDPLLTEKRRPQIILIDRYIDSRFAETRISMIDKAIREEEVNFVCLWIDSPQGDPAAVSQLAAFLSELDPKSVRTVAYIPTMARGSLPLLALACDDIIMHPDAVLGGDNESISSADHSDLLATVNKLIVPRKMRNRALSLALFDPEQTVYAFRHLGGGAVQFLTENEWSQLADSKEWQRGEKITREGMALRLTGQQAEDLGVARDNVRNFSELQTMFGLQGDPAFAEPNWVDHLVGILASPGLAWLLILIGLAGIYTEVQMPGIGIGGFLAAVAFTIYFWANFMNHTANELEIVLFLVGVSCLILEIFIIPGFGIFGLGGGILILIALILASQTFVLPQNEDDLRQLRNSLMTVGGALIGLALFAVISRRLLPHSPLLSRLILPAQSQPVETAMLKDSPQLLGAVGKTLTNLRPSGKAVFAQELVDVIAEGEWISAGTTVEVTEVHGTRILVRPNSD